MVLMLSLAVLAGLGVASLMRESRLWGWCVVIVALAAHAVVVLNTPFPRDVALPTGDLQPVPAYLDPSKSAPPVYSILAATDRAALVVELPFGEPAYELRYMYAGLFHGRRLLNGYSGVFPPSYVTRAGALRTPWASPEAAWSALAPAEYVVVHGAAWSSGDADSVRQWLRDGGAKVMAAVGEASVWQLPPWAERGLP